MSRRPRLVLAIALMSLLAFAGMPLRMAVGSELLEDSAEQKDALGEAVDAFASDLADGGLAALWDELSAVEVREDADDADVDAEALEALGGETSTAAGVTRAFAMVAERMGLSCGEELSEGGQPVVRVEVDGEEVLLDVAAGKPGERPWEKGDADGDEDDSADGDEDDSAVSEALTAQSTDDEPATDSETAEQAASAEESLEAQSSEPSVSYGVHRQTYGDQAKVSNGAVAGTTGESKRLEALWISVKGGDVTGGVRYRVHAQGIGWQDWRSDGQKAGTTGESRRLEAVEVSLTGNLAKKYDVWYRVHAQRVGWMQWAKNGESAGTEGMAWRLEAVQILLVEKGGSAPGAVEGVTSAASTAHIAVPEVSYCTHVQTYGWQDWRSNGQGSGTTGEAKRLEALRVRLGESGLEGSVQYCTHVQTYGWQDWVDGDDLAGTTGESKRLEGVRIRLTGELSNYFDVWYRVHAQTLGWMGWASNGASAGTEGMSKRLEAIEVVVKPKGWSAPGSTANSFREAERSEDTSTNLILVGDSRTFGMYGALYGAPPEDEIINEEEDKNGTWWLMRSGAGYSWLKKAAIKRVEKHLGKDSVVVIWLGVNDIFRFTDFKEEILQYSDEGHYADLINAKAKKWKKKGARVYYATVGPLGSSGNMDDKEKKLYGSYNKRVRTWNDRIVSKLSSDVEVLDAYEALVDDYNTVDGLHYDDPTYRRFYDFVCESVL